MPRGDIRHTRLNSNSGGYYLQSPPSTQPYSDPRLQDTSSYYTSLPMTSMSQSPYSQTTHQAQTLYTMAPQVQAPPPAVQAPYSRRSSTGAWSPADDQTLMQARQANMNWGPIKTMYFPSKTPNACRKRHERLMEKRNVDEWDHLKLENVAKNYMAMRKEIWAGLAEATGEKWTVVEQKCMTQGLKNIQQAARSSARRERLQVSPSYAPYSSSSSSSYHPDHADEFEDVPDYNDGSSDRSSGYGHGYSNSGSSSYDVSAGRRGERVERVSSLDMGIDAIINPPRQ
ncbi:hypothetical protein HYALB_00009388 [Hymenoscyphus albidus]|uniref:Myb-like domain-containing protein n=1 Tax=Hymenoscyphus albidus TaxID=595503 RepID=A0A9N9LD85_9HELO|nr:hypothetical protein HYALB_00009388 [Hymenoscyphus albidus]